MKTINDTQGHLAGDRVIQDFAATLVRVCRSRDYIVRTGGDEFLVIVPGCTEESIEGLEHRLLSEVAQARLATGSPSRPEIQAGKANTQSRAITAEKIISYSASFGSAYCPDWGKIGPERLRALIEEADGVLYRHKGKKAETRT
jgi:GGDEF domain-containing protein